MALIVVPMLVRAAPAAGVATSPVVFIAALTVTACRIYRMLPSFRTLPTVDLQGLSTAGAFAMINSTGALGGFVRPHVVGWVEERRGPSLPASLSPA
jgi:MFS transporter, ACS family, tartrate transporter